MRRASAPRWVAPLRKVPAGHSWGLLASVETAYLVLDRECVRQAHCILSSNGTVCEMLARGLVQNTLLIANRQATVAIALQGCARQTQA